MISVRARKALLLWLWRLCASVFAIWFWVTYKDLFGMWQIAASLTILGAGSLYVAGLHYLVRSRDECKARPLWLRVLMYPPTIPIAFLAIVGTTAVPVLKWYLLKDVSFDLGKVIDYDPVLATRVNSSDDELICTYSVDYRVPIRFEWLNKDTVNAFIAAEDQNFYEHHGFDLWAVFRAIRDNADNYFRKSGKTKQGASTLTAQVVKNVIAERRGHGDYQQKLKEFFIAWQLESKMASVYGKDAKKQIAEIYFNDIYLGQRSYGIQAAARVYFGKDAGQLTLAEASMLAGLPKAPSRFSPLVDLARAKSRQEYVLNRMVALGFITAKERTEAYDEQLVYISGSGLVAVFPEVCRHTEKELVRMFGKDTVYKHGLEVTSTIDAKKQRMGIAAVRKGLQDLESKIGFKGPEGHRKPSDRPGECGPSEDEVIDNTVASGVVTEIKPSSITVCVEGLRLPLEQKDFQSIQGWTSKDRTHKLELGDLITVRVESRKDKSGKRTQIALLAQKDEAVHEDTLEAGLMVTDPATGHVLVMVSGYDAWSSYFNLVTQAHRQAGSSIKPVVYATALEHGFTVETKVDDHPVCYPGGDGHLWCPKNYIGHSGSPFKGVVSLATALAQSLNSVSVQIAAKFGIHEVIRVARSLGYTSHLDPVLPLAIGAADVTLYEHTMAYTSIAANGHRIPSHEGSTYGGIIFTKIVDRKGHVIFPKTPIPLVKDMPQAMPASDAYALTYLMEGVVDHGTGRQAKSLGRPIAGKTGTTNDSCNAWFMGFSANYVTGVWVGRWGKNVPIYKGATGADVALPIFITMMEMIHEGIPPQEFPIPGDVSLYASEGRVIPFQRGEVPEHYLTGSISPAAQPAQTQ